MTIRQALVFAILMENNNGILGKAPSYINEKARVVDGMNRPELLLDGPNTKKFKDWQDKWGVFPKNDEEESK